MVLDLFLNFKGNCREALDFYAEVFQSNIEGLMTYDDAPPSEGYVTPEADKNKIMYANLKIGGTNVMFSDAPEGIPHIVGNNVVLTISVPGEAEVQRLFQALNNDPNPQMPPQKTFFADCFAMANDKFGIIWNIST